MAIFNNGDITNKNSTTDSNTTIITVGAKIKGEIDLGCNLYIDGSMEGTINSSQDVNVGKNGYVQGNIVSKRVVVQGHVKGIIEADRVEIKAAGHVNGEIRSIELVIESKGIFEGNSIVKNSDKSNANKITNTEA